MPPASAAEAQQEMENFSSPIGAFLRERYVVGPGRSVECVAIFNDWVDWCAAQNRAQPGNVQGFGRDLRAAVPGLSISQHRIGTTSRTRCYEGLGKR